MICAYIFLVETQMQMEARPPAWVGFKGNQKETHNVRKATQGGKPKHRFREATNKKTYQG